jgi:hypothetical protein
MLKRLLSQAASVNFDSLTAEAKAEVEKKSEALFNRRLDFAGNMPVRTQPSYPEHTYSVRSALIWTKPYNRKL